MNKRLVSLIPGGIVQFMDFAFDIEPYQRRKLSFEERPVQGSVTRQDGWAQCKKELHCYQWDDEHQRYTSRSPLNGVKGDEPEIDYEVKAARALEVFSATWIPVPFFRVRPEKWHDGARRCENGPLNWARVWLVRDEESPAGSMWRLVLAFDTTVEECFDMQTGYHALSPKDVEANAQFTLAFHERDNALFLDAEWVDKWIYDVYEGYLSRKNKGRKRRVTEEDEDAFVMEYLACYLTFLDLLHHLDIFPVIKVVDPSQSAPIEVDLVLDIGNSRTCGMLVETRPQSTTRLNDSYILQIRDLSQPDKIYREPFESRIEFCEAAFGNPRLSARSGRTSGAFTWPSIIRVGREAARLNSKAWGGEGSTGLSSPKRYLWDQRPRLQQWRLNGISPDGVREPPATSVVTEHVNREGTPLERVSSKAAAKDESLRWPAFEARYTRSSQMMFLLQEILTHALVTINSPGQRLTREHPDLPRRLRRVVITLPSAMALVEQDIFRRWALWAVEVLWRTLGWHEPYYVGQGRQRTAKDIPDGIKNDFRINPEVECNWDEATCSQLVFLFNELNEKYARDVGHFFQLLGKPCDTRRDNPTLRVASIDVGGGTTDLSIITYTALNWETASASIKPKIEFREGFSVAGDDILGAVIEDQVLPALQEALGKAGVVEPRGLLSRLFGRDVLGQSQEERNRRTLFTRQVLVPAGLYLLSLYEQADMRRPQEVKRIPLKETLAEDAAPGAEVIGYLERACQEEGGVGFQLLEVPLRFNALSIDQTVRGIMGGVLTDLGEIIHLYDCDVFLLTGRASRLPAILGAVRAKLPLPPHRILRMSDYRVGRWYPFSDFMGAIPDPKTTVVVGAILGTLSKGHLSGFSVDTTHFSLGSTARFIGEMDQEGKIKPHRVWFELDVNAKEDVDLEKEVIFSGPISIGFRQMAVERWPTSRFYIMDFSSAAARENARSRTPLPYYVNVLYTRKELDEEAVDNRDEGNIKIEEITASNDISVRKDEVETRLQTLPSEEGYWLDTGIFNVA